MKNTQKGFVSILLILLVIIMVGGGIYFYSKNKSQKTLPQSEIPKENNETISDKKDLTNESKVQNFKEKIKEPYKAFYFTAKNPSIISSTTKAIVQKKQNITKEDLKDIQYGEDAKIIKQNPDFVLIEVPTGGCLGSDNDKGFAPFYIYASSTSEKIFVFKFATDGQTDVTYQIENIQKYIDEIKDKPEEKEIVIQPTPADIISDGYHYAKFISYDNKTNTIKLDFLSLRDDVNHDLNLDIVMNKTMNTIGINGNVLLENNTVNIRTVPFSIKDISYENLKWIYDLVIGTQYYEVLLKIKNGIIIEIMPISNAC